MNRFSYLAAITAVNADPTGLKSNQLLLETGIGLTKNIRTFSYSDVTATDPTPGGWATITDTVDTAAFEAAVIGTGVVNAFNLVKDEYFIIEINQALDGLVFLKDGGTGTGSASDPIVATGSFTNNLTTTKTNADTSLTTVLVDGSSYIDGTNIFGADTTGFIKNYLYPAFLFKCTGGDGTTDGDTVGFAAEATVGTGASAAKYYQSWKCTVKGTTGGRGDGTDSNLLAHDSLAELNADASNRLVASTIQDLSLTQTGGVLNKVTTENPTNNDSGNWLTVGIVDNFGKKLAGEFFTVGANTEGKKESSVIKAATMEVIATANCKSYGSTLNFLTPHAKYVSGATYDATNKVYDGRAYMVPADATPGQKYYSCLKVGQADPETLTTATDADSKDVYTTVEVDVTRPTFWQYSDTVTDGSTAGLFASPGSANAGLPSKIDEWGLPAITAVDSDGVTAWAKDTMGAENTNSDVIPGDMTKTGTSGVTAAHWEGASTVGIQQLSVNAYNGDYLVYKFSATTATQKLIANFWTGQAGMGRSSLPAETDTFKHLELFSFAQPGNLYTVGANNAAKPVVVLRVPEAAWKGDGTAKYYAGFQVSDDADAATAKFYTTSLTVTVTGSRRFGSVANWEKSLVQPLFTDIIALGAANTPRTSEPSPAEIRADTDADADPTPDGQWGTKSMVTGAIPGQVVGFKLPDQVRIEEVLTTTDADTPLLEDRGSFMGSTAADTSGNGNGGRISFMVPVDAGTTTKYYASLKITNASNEQYLAVSVELEDGAKSTGTNAILSDGLNTLNTGTAGDATVTVSEATVKAGGASTPPANWWTNTDYILTPDLELMDSAKAVIAFNANVGLEDTTADDVPALTPLRSAHIPADGFKTASTITATEWSTFPVIEVQMPTTQDGAGASNVDYTNAYLYRTYKMHLGRNGNSSGATYYGAIRAKNISPEIWTTKTNFDAAIPLSAAGYKAFKFDTDTTADDAAADDAKYYESTAWVTSTTAPTDGTDSAAGVWVTNTVVAATSKNNQITRNVENGNSFVIAIDHDLGTVTWENAAVPAGKALERRETLNCTTFAEIGTSTTAPDTGECIPSWSFRVPFAAQEKDVYYAAFKAVVATTSNGLAAGTYWVSIAATVPEPDDTTTPIRHYATWDSLSTGDSKRDAVMWSFTNVNSGNLAANQDITGADNTTVMDDTADTNTTMGFNKQWILKTAATDVPAGWHVGASNLFAANVAAGAEACFDFSEFTSPSLVTAEVETGGDAYTATTGSEPVIAAQVTTDQLHNTDAGIQAWCFTAPASGFGYVIVKTDDWYLPIKISTEDRERAFPSVADFTADAGTRWSGSVSRVYNDLAKQWADTPTDAKINTDFLIDEVAVKKASDGTDEAAAVDIGAFAVIITNPGNTFTKCTEYDKDDMEDTADSPSPLERPTPWLKNFGSVHSAADFSRVGDSDWAFSWQVPSDATATDTYYIGLRCQTVEEGVNDFSAMWKVSVTDAPTFTAKSADLAVAPGNQKAAFTKFADAGWVGPKTTQPDIPDPRRDAVTASFEVEAGSGFSVEINIDGVTAEVVAEADLIDKFGGPLDLQARSLILFGEVAGFEESSGSGTDADPIVAAKWSALTDVTDDAIFPAYSWQVPSGASVGEVHYAAVRAVDNTSNNYVALFEVVVKAAPVPDPEPEEEESSGVMGAVITTALVTAAIAAALFFFVL